MDKESAEKKLLEIHGENSFFMNSPSLSQNNHNWNILSI